MNDICAISIAASLVIFGYSWMKKCTLVHTTLTVLRNDGHMNMYMYIDIDMISPPPPHDPSDESKTATMSARVLRGVRGGVAWTRRAKKQSHGLSVVSCSD